MTPPEVLRLLHARRVLVWEEGGRLRYRSPGPPPADVAALLSAHKAALLSLLSLPGVVITSTDPERIGGRWVGDIWQPPTS